MSTNDIYLEKLSKRKETQISDRKKEIALQSLLF